MDWLGSTSPHESNQDTPPNPLAEAKFRFQSHLLVTFLALFIVWTVKILETVLHESFISWGLEPRTLKGLLGIVTMPFLHADFEHLYSNSFGIFILFLGMMHFYEKIAAQVTLFIVLSNGVLVWLLARPSYHIGASGLVYGLSAFIFLSGVMRRDRPTTGAALLVALLFGSLIWGLFPFQQGISWEGHLFGALSGCYFALFYRHSHPPPSLSEDDENLDREMGW